MTTKLQSCGFITSRLRNSLLKLFWTKGRLLHTLQLKVVCLHLQYFLNTVNNILNWVFKKTFHKIWRQLELFTNNNHLVFEEGRPYSLHFNLVRNHFVKDNQKPSYNGQAKISCHSAFWGFEISHYCQMFFHIFLLNLFNRPFSKNSVTYFHIFFFYVYSSKRPPQSQ